MSDSTVDGLNIREQMARIDRNQADIQKLFAETAKLNRISSCLGRDTWRHRYLCTRDHPSHWGAWMSPTRLRSCLAVLRWSQRGLADARGCDDRLVRRWASGEASVAPEVADWLERAAAFHLANPAPVEWKRRAA